MIERDVTPVRWEGVVSDIRGYGPGSSITVVLRMSRRYELFGHCGDPLSRVKAVDSVLVESGSLDVVIRLRTGGVIQHSLRPGSR